MGWPRIGSGVLETKKCYVYQPALKVALAKIRNT